MSDKVLAAVRTAPEVTVFQEFDMPDIPDDAALLRVEVAGICGTDVKFYSKPPIDRPRASWGTRTSATSPRPARRSRNAAG